MFVKCVAGGGASLEGHLRWAENEVRELSDEVGERLTANSLFEDATPKLKKDKKSKTDELAQGGVITDPAIALVGEVGSDDVVPTPEPTTEPETSVESKEDGK